jgi:cadmium resistance protein CadD (predicted permease)
MSRRKASRAFMGAIAVVCWAVALFVFSGGAFPEDTLARLLFGLIWTLTGIWWMVQHHRAGERNEGSKKTEARA